MKPDHPTFPTEWTVRQVLSFCLSHFNKLQIHEYRSFIGWLIVGSCYKPDLVLRHHSLVDSLRGHLQTGHKDLGLEDCGFCHFFAIAMEFRFRR